MIDCAVYETHPNDRIMENMEVKTQPMKPYKKRSFNSQSQITETSMETENSDDSDKQIRASPPCEEPEKEKDVDKEGEIRGRKKWKRKISRKQFRHHDIKLFTPGQYRAAGLLKQIDSSLKKGEMTSKESITESIVTSLGGQKQVFSAQKAPRIEDGATTSLHSPKSDIEENNNVNSTQNNNTGKHQLPAIIMENPTHKMRRCSLESNHIPKPSTFLKHLDTQNKNNQEEIVCESMVPNDVVPAQLPNIITDPHVSSSNTNPETYEELRSSPAKSNYMKQAIEENNVEMEVSSVSEVEIPLKESKGLCNEFSQNRIPKAYGHNSSCEKQKQEQASEPMETDSSEEQPENLSLKRSFPSDVPVDLSKKTPTNQNQRGSLTSPSKKNGRDMRFTFENGPLIIDNPFKKTAIIEIETNKVNTHTISKQPDNNDLYSEELPPHVESVSNKSIKENNLKHFSKYQNTFSNSVMINLNTCQEILQHLLKQEFTTRSLELMSQAYQQLEFFKDHPDVSAEARLKSHKILDDVLNYISTKLKHQLDLQLNALEVIKILGQPEKNVNKTTLQGYLENIQRIRKLDINDLSPSATPLNLFTFKDKQLQNIGQLAAASAPYLFPSAVNRKIHVSEPNASTNEVPLRHSKEDHNFFNIDSFLPAFSPQEVQLRVPHTSFPIGDHHKERYNSLGRPRSRSHKYNEGTGKHQYLKRSLSNPHNVALEHTTYPWNPWLAMETSNTRGEIISSQHIVSNDVLSRNLQQNLSQNGDLNITPPTIAQKHISGRINPEGFAPPTTKYRHTYPTFSTTTAHASLPELHKVKLSKSSPNVSSKRIHEHPNPNVQEKLISFLHSKSKEDRISSTTDNLGASTMNSIPRHVVYQEKAEPRLPKIQDHSRVIPAVIVADTSMQITKEPTVNSNNLDTMEERARMNMITSSSENTSSSEESLKQAVDKDQEENNPEFLIWLEKLRKNKKLKSKFLSQMGILKTEHSIPVGDCIEIIDSDEEKPKKIHSNSSQASESASRPNSQEISSIQYTSMSENITTIRVPPALQIIAVPPVTPESIKSPTTKPSLSKVNYIPPIPLPYVASSAGVRQEYPVSDKKKTIYSPEIEPISPVGNEPSFTFPQISTAAKISPPVVSNTDRGIILCESVTSPGQVQKRKTPSGFSDYKKEELIALTRKSSEFSTDKNNKRRKSLDRPQTAMSPRIAPSGKLCYVRESHIFLRYFDDTQVELFIRNLSSQDEELLRTTGTDPEKIKNSFKHSNFGIEQLGKTEILHLPKHVEFSKKEDLPDVEEFVKESDLVEQFVPKDFADFYRYVTGFQIIKNKHPVSLQTFLTMYNTNRTSELLWKYLQRRDEDLSRGGSR